MHALPLYAEITTELSHSRLVEENLSLSLTFRVIDPADFKSEVVQYANFSEQTILKVQGGTRKFDGLEFIALLRGALSGLQPVTC